MKKNKKMCVVRLELAKHRRLMAKAAKQGIKIQKLLEGWVDEFLKGEKNDTQNLSQ